MIKSPLKYFINYIKGRFHVFLMFFIVMPLNYVCGNFIILFNPEPTNNLFKIEYRYYYYYTNNNIFL